MIQISRDKTDGWNILLLILCLWLGHRMITARYFSNRYNFSSGGKNIGDELHYPIPLITKDSEFAEELYGRRKI